MEPALDMDAAGARAQERDAILRCQRGEAEAFKLLVERYQRLAYFVALGLVGCHDDAVDVSQEAFIRAFRHIRRFDAGRQFLPWFYRLLRNLCFNHLRARRAQRLFALEETDPEEVEDSAPDFDPEVLVERDERATAVWQAIGRLPERYREIIVLRHFQQLSYAQMAELLSVPMGTVMSRLYHARRALKRLLEQDQGGDLNEV